ncbi:ornithine decarboxylase [Microterricola gilva]|uniref:Ornithine decarboxylase n=1 Tax=Microterricola gilva TaxID=393267 RepID=A0A4Q8AIH1_9MICO|nr:type III PLP-dependent enzyme [Microterricola gilva]RZU64250.1 ornithine decarboxylase [Microterricola gilva]
MSIDTIPSRPRSAADRTRRDGLQRHERRSTGRAALHEYASTIGLAALVRRAGTPLFVLDPARVAGEFERFAALLPFVRLRYALAALPHPAVIRTVASCGGGFDAVSTGELAMLAHEQIPASDAVFSHPIKRADDIVAAAAAGVRLFVADNPAEVRKFTGVNPELRLLLRLRRAADAAGHPLDGAHFGIDTEHALNLARFAASIGVRVAGFSVHVAASEPDAPAALSSMLHEALRLIDEGNARWGLGLDTIDLGGGMPAEHEGGEGVDAIAEVVRNVLAPRVPQLRVLAVLGRCIAAPAMLLATSVVGQATRDGEIWHYLDDGMHGSFAGLRGSGEVPSMFSLGEIERAGADEREPLYPCTLAGASTDGIDVIARGIPLPPLGLNDVLLCPDMGAYSLVMASNFEAVHRTRVHVLRPSRAQSKRTVSV